LKIFAILGFHYSNRIWSKSFHGRWHIFINIMFYKVVSLDNILQLEVIPDGHKRQRLRQDTLRESTRIQLLTPNGFRLRVASIWLLNAGLLTIDLSFQRTVLYFLKFICLMPSIWLNYWQQHVHLLSWLAYTEYNLSLTIKSSRHCHVTVQSPPSTLQNVTW
jgi:hypothetical protein